MIKLVDVMKTSLEHLPERKRTQLAEVAKLYAEKSPAEMVILFGSHARGDWVEDPENGYISDYDLLVVVMDAAVAADTALWSKIEDEARTLTGHVLVNAIVHDINEVNDAIREGQYFFVDVIREGVLLYDTTTARLAKLELLEPKRRARSAVNDFQYWFENGRDFWAGSGHFAGKGKLAPAAFLLHQAAESFFHAVVLVFTAYKHKTHDLKFLAELSAPFDEGMAGALPRGTPEDKRLFGLLNRAYIEARYSKHYRITAEELAELRERVRDLAARVRAACVERLRLMGAGERVDERLPEVPTYEDVTHMPEPPMSGDPAELAAWRDELVGRSLELGQRMGEARGHERGVREGEARGHERGIQEGRARAVAETLRRRGITLSDIERNRILACRDNRELNRLEELAWSVTDAGELSMSLVLRP